MGACGGAVAWRGPLGSKEGEEFPSGEYRDARIPAHREQVLVAGHQVVRVPGCGAPKEVVIV